MKSCNFPPSIHFKKGLAKFIIGVRLIYGFRQKGKNGCDLYPSIYGSLDLTVPNNAAMTLLT